MTYPTTTRTIYMGPEAAYRVKASTLRFFHTTNEPAHTLQNGVIMLEENTGTRTRDSGAGRGKRGSSIRLQAYMRIDELGIVMESAVAPGVTADFIDSRSQTLTMVGGPAGGDFKLTFQGQQTGTIAYNATGANIETALEALSNLDPADVSVSGAASGPWTVTFAGAYADPGLPGVDGPGILTVDNTGLTGGTNPHVTVTTPLTITGVYERTYTGGSATGASLTIQFYNGLYWREMVGMRVNTCNVQGSGVAMVLVDMELVGPASYKIPDPTPVAEMVVYKPVDVPMQAVYFDGTIDADVDRMSLNINNNLTPRNTMDGTTSMKRQHIGFFAVEIDGMVDYPQYTGSYYQKMEDGEFDLGAMEVVFLDDIRTVGTAPDDVHPYAVFRVPEPLLADTTEGNDGGELVQMVRGRAEPSPSEAATLIVKIATDHDNSWYAGT